MPLNKETCVTEKTTGQPLIVLYSFLYIYIYIRERERERASHHVMEVTKLFVKIPDNKTELRVNCIHAI